MSKCKCPPRGASKLYLLSFGDTMTALLAFFIVLNSLAKEQTGANIHAGTGSFVNVLSSFGLPGLFGRDRSDQAFQMEEAGPHYLIEGDGETTERDAAGPDAESNGERVINREQEDFERFLNEMGRLHEVDRSQESAGEVVFDVLDPMPAGPPYVTSGIAAMLKTLLPVLLRPDSEVEITVWATTPSATAWPRATLQAAAIAEEFATLARLAPEQRQRLRTRGRPWISSDVRRPTLSVTIRRYRSAQ